MPQIIGINNINKLHDLKISADISFLGLFEHLFKSGNNFIISKFITNFIESKYYTSSEFSIQTFVEKQTDLLSTNTLLLYKNETIDISNSSDEEILALLNTRDILVYYTHILGYNKLYKENLKLYGGTKIISQYVEFKENLIKRGDIDFLPIDLSWKSNNYTLIKKTDKQILFSELISNIISKEDIPIELTMSFNNQAYIPTRGGIRFFLYHFFGFATFSEEMKNTVKLGTIFEPSKHEELYDNNPHIKKTEGGQYNIIESILQGKNTLGILSTGSGKSITFLLDSSSKRNFFVKHFMWSTIS